jgi:hypothetical protein
MGAVKPLKRYPDTGAIQGPAVYATGDYTPVEYGGTGATTAAGARAALGTVGSTWNPILTNTTNIDSSSAYLSSYMQLGDIVHCSGMVDVDATAASACVLSVSVPVASDFANVYEASGLLVGQGGGVVGSIEADATNDLVLFKFTPTGTASVSYFFNFTYQVN